jgi:hypothetical protein
MQMVLHIFRTICLSKDSLNPGWHIIIPINPCKQFGANLQSVRPNPHTPYVHAKHAIDQSQVSP